MSTFHINTEIDTKNVITPYKVIKTTEIINTMINIDLSSTKYKVSKIDNKTIELVPNNTDGMFELTNLFPASKYDITFYQFMYKHHSDSKISIYLHIVDKESQKTIHMTESGMLSDNDYNYIRDIIAKEFPDHKWRTIDECLTYDIKSYLNDYLSFEIITDISYEFIEKFVMSRYKEAKIDGYVEFDDNIIENIVKETISEALKSYNEK